MYSRGRQTKRSLFEKVLLQKNVHRNTKLFTKHASYMFLKRGQKGVPFTAIKIFELFKKGGDGAKLCSTIPFLLWKIHFLKSGAELISTLPALSNFQGFGKGKKKKKQTVPLRRNIKTLRDNKANIVRDGKERQGLAQGSTTLLLHKEHFVPLFTDLPTPSR